MYLKEINRFECQSKMDYFKLNKFLLHCNGLYHYKNDGRVKKFCLKAFTYFLIILYIIQSLQSFLNIRNSGVDDLVTTCCSVLQGGEYQKNYNKSIWKKRSLVWSFWSFSILQFEKRETNKNVWIIGGYNVAQNRYWNWGNWYGILCSNGKICNEILDNCGVVLLARCYVMATLGSFRWKVASSRTIELY